MTSGVPRSNTGAMIPGVPRSNTGAMTPGVPRSNTGTVASGVPPSNTGTVAVGVPRLHVITDCSALARATLRGGAPAVQVRIKGRSDAAVLTECERIVAEARTAGAVVVVNDRADIALAAGADGVHGGADDLPVAVLRQLLGRDALVGGTARDPGTALRLQHEGASYVGVGPVYASASKTGLPRPLGPAGVEKVAAAVDLPVIAIAGVTAARIPELMDAGAHGVAVIGAVAHAPDPAAATTELLEALGA